MPENIYEVLLANHRKLVREVLDKSEEISKFLMLVYSHVLYTASDSPRDPKDIYFLYSIENGQNGDFIKIDMRYKRSDTSRHGGLEGRNPIKRNVNLVTLCGSNSNVRDIAIRVVELLERWINEKPYRRALGLKSIKLNDAMFWKNLIFTADIMLHIQWEEMVKLKLKFFDEEELKNEHPIVNGGYLI